MLPRQVPEAGFRIGAAIALLALLTAGGSSRAVAGTSESFVQSLPPNDRLLVLPTRAGPFRYLNGWKSGEGVRTDYRSAVSAFGQPSSRKEEWLPAEWFPESYGDNPKSAGYCHVTWAEAGITVSFFSWSGYWPPLEEDTGGVRTIDPCEATEVATGVLTAIRLFGPGWRNRTGYRVGAPPPAGRPQLVRNSFQTPDGLTTVGMWASLDAQSRVRALNAKILGWP